MKYLAYSSFLFIVMCFGTYYAVTKEALGRIPPTLFACGTMLLLLPVALVLCLLGRKDITREVLIRGSLLGGCLCAVTLLLTVALEYTSATATAFFPCLNGLLAALFTRLVLRRPVLRLTWGAAILALLGMGLMTASTTISLDEWRGTLLALLGSVTYTGYIFLFDHLLVGYQTDRPTGFWPVLGIQLLTMAAGGLVILLLFGDWQALHPELRDLLALLYVGVFILLLPLLLAACLQRYVDPTSVAFIYTLEPVLGAVVAFLYLHEMFSLTMYAGQGLVLCGVLFQTALSVGPLHTGKGHRAILPLSQRFGRRYPRGILAGLVAVVLLGGGSATLSRWTPVGVIPPPTVKSTSPVVGRASFFSSGILDTQFSHGINDGLELDLEDMPPPAAGTAYYGWLLPDTENARSLPILLGKLPFSRGRVDLRYLDPQSTDLLAMSSRVLITIGTVQGPPVSPFLDHSTWRYYGQIPQPSATGLNAPSHLLAHLRFLLTLAPTMPGGLRLWFLSTTRSLLEGASATQETGSAEDPSFLRSDLSRMLIELDGSAQVQQDVPVGTPLYAPPQTVQVPLLQLEPMQTPSGYLVQIGQQLVAISHEPDATPEMRQIAIAVSERLTVVEAALQHVRQDARQLVTLNDAQLAQPAAQTLLDDLVEQMTAAYAGTVNPQTGEREGGSLWIADQLERLAAIAIEPCAPARCTTTSMAST
jgi:drug/metabolite transporter (DMT)-like permease